MNGQSKIIHNYYSVKQYNDDFFRLVMMKKPRYLGFDDDYIPPRDVNEVKMDESVIRSRRLIFEYAMCNDFDMFVTLTLNKLKMDRYDLDKYNKKLSQFLRDYGKKHGIKIQYLLVPEKHKDGAWHIHGLIKGIPVEHLEIFTLDDPIPWEMKKMLQEGHKLYNWIPYTEKFGWVSMEAIKSKIAVSKYITKYVMKSIETIQTDKTRKNKRLFYATHNLKKPLKIKEGTFQAGNIPSAYQPVVDNEYCWAYELTKEQYEAITTKLYSDISIPQN